MEQLLILHPGKMESRNNAGGNENCVESSGNGFWNDKQCSHELPYFCRKPSEHSFCKIDFDKRHDCGYYGIDQTECIDIGCCWNPVPDDVPGPWCFHPSNSVACLNKGGTCVRKGSGSKCNRGFEEGLCENDGNSGAEQVCCINCMTSECKQEEQNWH